MKLFFRCFCTFLLAFQVMADEVSVTFKVIPDSMPDGAVFIAGDQKQLGQWSADSVQLTEQDDGSWIKTIAFDQGTHIKYKITRGSWMTEALNANNEIPADAVLEVISNTTITIKVGNWKDQIFDANGQITGTVIYHRNMEGEGILSRDVLVWLPISYDVETEKRFPVLYMHDAQQVFDPKTSTHGADWRVDEWADELIEEERMKEIIVVASTCTANRGPEYSDGPEGKAYQRFLVKQLKPFIDKEYRTLTDRENTAVMGSSMGGLSSFLLAWHYPDVFSVAGCLSPAFWGDVLKMVEAYEGPPKNIRLYFDNGGVGMERDLQIGIDWMLELLQQKGFVVGSNLVWVLDMEAEHNEAAWAERVWMPLLYMFGIGKQSWIDDLPAIPEPIYANGQEPEFIDVNARRVIGLKTRLPWRDQDEERSKVWKQVLARQDELPEIADREAVGIYLDGSNDKPNYFAGIVVAEDTPVPAGMSEMTIPAGYCAAFKHAGSLISARETSQYIYEWWLPRSGYERTDFSGFEVSGGDPLLSSKNILIYVPVKK